jgi:hypothetical protein
MWSFWDPQACGNWGSWRARGEPRRSDPPMAGSTTSRNAHAATFDQASGFMNDHKWPSGSRALYSR